MFKFARRVRRLIKIVFIGLTLAAVAQELTKPEDERTWRGRVFGVPYDFRPPTWERIKEAYWNAEDDRLFTDRVFGVGWAVNLYRARTLLEQFYAGRMPAARAPKRTRRAAASRKSAG
ncbi:MAG TPA: DUF5808 domain-containing protein [Candidatus Acidoferrales bacterium]|nr:DUF5808 domain-containing protein [Candidatus Acidoferrales bacterium]